MNDEINTDLIKQHTAQELLAARGEILRLCRVARVALYRIRKIADRHLGEGQYIGSSIEGRDPVVNDKGECRKIVDAAFWKFVVDSSFITNTMTEKAKAEFEKNNRDNPIQFIESELIKFSERAEQYFVNNGIETIKEVYKRFINCRYYGSDWSVKKYDNCRKIESQFRISGSITYSWGRFSDNYHGSGSIYEDLLTACYLIDRGVRPNYESRFHALSNDAFRDGGDTVVTPYFTVQAFKNGNQKVTWAKDKLNVLADLNRYGAGDSKDLPQTMRKKYKPEHFQESRAAASA